MGIKIAAFNLEVQLTKDIQSNLPTPQPLKGGKKQLIRSAMAPQMSKTAAAAAAVAGTAFVALPSQGWIWSLFLGDFLQKFWTCLQLLV